MRIDRYGLMPMFVACGILILFALAFLNWMINNVWLVPTGAEAFVDLRRAVAEGRADANALLAASDYGLIVLFLIAVTIIGFGASLPFVYFVNRRIRITRQLAEARIGVLLRQALWVGLWCALCVLLQMNRLLTLPIGFMVLLMFGLIEMFILVRKKSAETLASVDSEQASQRLGQ